MRTEQVVDVSKHTAVGTPSEERTDTHRYKYSSRKSGIAQLQRAMLRRGTITSGDAYKEEEIETS